MGRKHNVMGFQSWLAHNEEAERALIRDFIANRLNGTALLAAYRRHLVKVKPRAEKVIAKIAVDTNMYHCIEEPFDMDYVKAQINNSGSIEGVVKIEPDEVLGKSIEEIKQRLAELLVGCSEFEDIDDAIDFVFVGGDSQHLYIKVECFSLPLTAE